MDLKIDHVTVCGCDLERMRRAFAEVGLGTEYGGRHANGLTHMALVGFDDGSYLELIAPVNAADPTLAARAKGMMSGWMPLMTGDAGVGAWAVRVKGIHEEVEGLRRRGIAVRGPEAGGRTRPDGTRLEWDTALVGAGAAGSVLPFMIEDRTERALRVQALGVGFIGVVSVMIGVRDLSGASALFDRAFGLGKAEVEERAELGIRLACFPGTPVMLAEPLGDSWLRGRLERFGECPAAVVLAAPKDVVRKMSFAETSEWFGRRVRWLDERTLGARVGVLEAQ